MTVEQVWPAGPLRPELGADEVHVWSASLDVSPAHLAELRRILADDEREKEGRLRFDRDKERYVASEGALRAILGRYVGTHPASLRFVRGPQGKPSLAPPGGPDIRFNMSHAQNLALYAVTRGREVGIDVEYVRDEAGAAAPGATRLDTTQIAEQFFSSYEVGCLRQLPPASRTRAFYHVWTRKEAYLKARGEGLTVPLDAFDVSVYPDEAVALLRVAQRPAEVARWSLWALEPAPGFVGTLVAEAPVDAPRRLALQYWRWGAW